MSEFTLTERTERPSEGVDAERILNLQTTNLALIVRLTGAESALKMQRDAALAWLCEWDSYLPQCAVDDLFAIYAGREDQ